MMLIPPRPKRIRKSTPTPLINRRTASIRTRDFVKRFRDRIRVRTRGSRFGVAYQKDMSNTHRFDRHLRKSPHPESHFEPDHPIVLRRMICSRIGTSTAPMTKATARRFGLKS
jgi:hypothetical protein